MVYSFLSLCILSYFMMQRLVFLAPVHSSLHIPPYFMSFVYDRLFYHGIHTVHKRVLANNIWQLFIPLGMQKYAQFQFSCKTQVNFVHIFQYSDTNNHTSLKSAQSLPWFSSTNLQYDIQKQCITKHKSGYAC